jgi:hypothetical protein
MKVFLHYEDSEDPTLHKQLKMYVFVCRTVIPPFGIIEASYLPFVTNIMLLSSILCLVTGCLYRTLPKSWKTGPTGQLLEQFIESYNGSTGKDVPLTASDMHLAIRESDGEKSKIKQIASDAIVIDCIPDRADVYIMHGKAKSLAEVEKEEADAKAAHAAMLKNTVQCTHFGCQNRFPRGGPYPECHYHKAPPVFHETAKFWSCCPHKKAYDWETFQAITGCMTGTCTEVKEDDQKLFLGGTDLREQAGETVKLKSIEDFNKAQAAGGDAAPVLERLQVVLGELGVEKELFDQVVDGIRSDVASNGAVGASEAQLLEETKSRIGETLKKAMKSIAAERLRLN